MAAVPSHDPEPSLPLGYLKQLFQFSLRQFAVGHDSGEMIADFADDVDREEKLFARDDIVDRADAPSRGVAFFQSVEGFG